MRLPARNGSYLRISEIFLVEKTKMWYIFSQPIGIVRTRWNEVILNDYPRSSSLIGIQDIANLGRKVASPQLYLDHFVNSTQRFRTSIAHNINLRPGFGYRIVGAYLDQTLVQLNAGERSGNQFTQIGEIRMVISFITWKITAQSASISLLTHLCRH